MGPFSFFFQGGTAAGLVIGMLAWYIGSGRGNGNPYGVTAATVSTTLPQLPLGRIHKKRKLIFFPPPLSNLARSYCTMLVHPNRSTDG